MFRCNDVQVSGHEVDLEGTYLKSTIIHGNIVEACIFGLCICCDEMYILRKWHGVKYERHHRKHTVIFLYRNLRIIPETLHFRWNIRVWDITCISHRHQNFTEEYTKSTKRSHSRKWNCIKFSHATNTKSEHLYQSHGTIRKFQPQNFVFNPSVCQSRDYTTDQVPGLIHLTSDRIHFLLEDWMRQVSTHVKDENAWSDGWLGMVGELYWLTLVIPTYTFCLTSTIVSLPSMASTHGWTMAATCQPAYSHCRSSNAWCEGVNTSTV